MSFGKTSRFSFGAFGWSAASLLAGLTVFTTMAAAQPATQVPSHSQPGVDAKLPAPDMSGRWNLNAGQSDDVASKLKPSSDDENRPSRKRGSDDSTGGGYPGGGYPGGGYPGGGYPGGRRGGLGIPGIGQVGGRGRQGNRQPSNQGNEQRGALQEQLQPSTALMIIRRDPEIDISDTNAVRQLFTDGRKVDEAQAGSSRIQQNATWDSGQLVVEEKTSNGEKLTRKYSLSEDGKQLDETVTVEGKRLTPLTLRFVYDRAPANQE